MLQIKDMHYGHFQDFGINGPLPSWSLSPISTLSITPALYFFGSAKSFSLDRVLKHLCPVRHLKICFLNFFDWEWYRKFDPPVAHLWCHWVLMVYLVRYI